MNVYRETMRLREARALFFERERLGPDGGYSARWVRVEAKPFPFYFPNWAARVAAARLHDLHHIAAGYATDWPGEVEISGWEIGSGCRRFHAAWILDLGGWAVGLVLAPARLFRAFVRGRCARTNLYRCGFDDARLDTTTVGMLRDELGLRGLPAPASAADIAAFSVWSTAAVALWVGLPAAVVGLGWRMLQRRAR